ncbi:MAG: N-formylglutamate amidohydrolase [Rhizobiales bacterium]|nr:N-formylglutamate amidohydrolase [Hyphomicrobiales bacterium]
MFVEPGLFYRYDPVTLPAPIVVDVSRSGREYPVDMRSPVPFTAIHDNVSVYVEDIWGDAPRYGATMLQALFPHMYIDANRDELDIDPDLVEGEWPVPLRPTVSKRGLGLLKSKSRYGEPVQERKFTFAEVEERLNRYHRPYHRELKSIIDRVKSSYGFVYHLSCHCMSAIGAPTHPDAGEERPDFCLGNIGETSASRAFTEAVAETIRAQGYSCTINQPYPGGEINRRYGDPAGGVESIMVEINKKRFMDVKTFRKNDGFDSIKNAANAVLAALAKTARQRIG